MNWTLVQTEHRYPFHAHLISAKPWTLIIKEYDKPEWKNADYKPLSNPNAMAKVLEHLIVGGMGDMPVLFYWDEQTGLHELHYKARNAFEIQSYHFVKIADTLETFEVLYGQV